MAFPDREQHRFYSEGTKSPMQPVALGESIAFYGIAKAEQSLTRDIVTNTWVHFWDAKARRAGLDTALTVPPCKYEDAELRMHSRAGRDVVLVPDEVWEAGGMVLLGRMFPEMELDERIAACLTSRRGNFETSTLVDMTSQPSRTGIGLENIGPIYGFTQRLPVYIAASQLHKLETGAYFDEGSTAKGEPYSTLISETSVSRLSLRARGIEYRKPQQIGTLSLLNGPEHPLQVRFDRRGKLHIKEITYAQANTPRPNHGVRIEQ